MEDVLEVYQRPADPLRPLVCLDEFAKQLLSESRSPLAAKPGSLAKYDSEYVREGSVTGFILAMPNLGQREVFISETGRRTSLDYAYCLEYLAALHSGAEKIILVMDNLNTHKEASLYEAFEPEKARMLCERFEIHYTPKHGSWLNMAEIEIGLLVRACLNQRLESSERMRQEVAAYLARKNAFPKPIEWKFSLQEARTKLSHVYPNPSLPSAN